jgi:hypothetical protein
VPENLSNIGTDSLRSTLQLHLAFEGDKDSQSRKKFGVSVLCYVIHIKR